MSGNMCNLDANSKHNMLIIFNITNYVIQSSRHQIYTLNGRKAELNKHNGYSVTISPPLHTNSIREHPKIPKPRTIYYLHNYENLHKLQIQYGGI